MSLAHVVLCTVAMGLMAACTADDPGSETMDPQQSHMIVQLPSAPVGSPADVSSPAAVVLALYETISGPPESERERNWTRLRSLVSPDATFRLVRWFYPDQVAEELRLWSVEEFIDAGKLLWRDTGFWERELWSRVDVFGNVAQVWSAYEGRVGSPDSDPTTRGVNSFQLVHMDGRWWLVSTAWDIETADNRVPLAAFESDT